MRKCASIDAVIPPKRPEGASASTVVPRPIDAPICGSVYATASARRESATPVQSASHLEDSGCVTTRAARLDPVRLLVDLAHEVLERGGDLVARGAQIAGEQLAVSLEEA